MKHRTLHIGITECSSSGPRSHKKTMEYIHWIESGVIPDAKIQCHIIATSKASQSVYQQVDLATLDALVLSGGDDIAPENLGISLSEAEIKACHLIPEPERDEIEFGVLQEALKLNLPILGICRGMQVVNVFLGGDVYLDHERDLPYAMNHKTISREESRYHQIKASSHSFLEKLILPTKTCPVSSRHHQSVKTPGEGLKVAAIAEDGVIEALESEDRSKRIWLVQWHPERMWLESKSLNKPELNNACSKGVLQKFLNNFI